MKQVCVISSTRAEYGLLRGVIKELKECENLSVNVVVTGTHLVENQGYTVKEIEADGVNIVAKIPIFPEENVSPTDAASKAIKAFGAFLMEEPQDLVVILGDRYEMLGFAMAACLNNVPIAHLHGGEITEGAIDDSIRHALTKLSYLHFTSTEEYRNRVIQMGEDPNRVFCVGAPGVENVLNVEKLSKEETLSLVNEKCNTSFDKDNPFALVTFHPVTTEPGKEAEQVNELLEALDQFSFMNFIITKANADAGGERINGILEEYAATRDNVGITASLGMKCYLNAMRYSQMVIGNSSSGIIEAPSFHIPTINIGDRQKGRTQSNTIIDCEPEKGAIATTIKFALTEPFRKECLSFANPYEKKDVAKRIADIICDYLINEKISKTKPFFDLKK